jgi:hypothetical protein
LLHRTWNHGGSSEAEPSASEIYLQALYPYRRLSYHFAYRL